MERYNTLNKTHDQNEDHPDRLCELSEGTMSLSFGEIQSFVSDLDQAKIFYGDILGLELMDQGKQWLVFDISGFDFVVIGMAQPGRPKSSYGAECATVLCLQSDDIFQDYETLKRRGVHFFSEINEVPSGRYYVAFQDPEGNLLELIQE